MSGYDDDRLAWKDLDGQWHYSASLGDIPAARLAAAEALYPDYNRIEQQIIQAQGIPPMSIGPGVTGIPPSMGRDTEPPPGMEHLRLENERLKRNNRELKAHRNQLYELASRSLYGKEKPVEVGPLPREVRIGDAVRTRYTEHLGNMLAQGVITMEEFDSRTDAVNAAKYERDLWPVVEDLPPLPGIVPGAKAVPAAREPGVFLKTWKAPGLVWAFAIIAWLCVFIMMAVH